VTEHYTEITPRVSPGGIAWQFLNWVALRPRTYAETMDAWRTSCPRLSVWEDAMTDELIWLDTRTAASQSTAIVRLTANGATALGLAKAANQPPVEELAAMASAELVGVTGA
jgi:hypothetical protein